MRNALFIPQLLAIVALTAAYSHSVSPDLRTPASADPFAKVAKLPVQQRPNTNETLALPSDSALYRALNTDRATFYRLRYLLPDRFRLAQGPEFQPLIDEAMLALAASETGKEAICVFSVDSARDVQTYFQVSAGAARKIRAGCAGRSYPPAVVHRLRVMREVVPLIQPVPLVPPKKFVFIFSESGRPSIEGYTTKNNTTYLVLHPETMNTAAIQRLMWHEIAMSYDQLSRLGYLLNVETIEDMGVNLAFGKRVQDSKTFALPTSKQLKHMRCAFRDPAPRYAAAVQRAFLFEDAIAAEVGGSPAVATVGSCARVLARNSVLLQQMSRVVAFDTGWYKVSCGIATDPVARVEEILERINVITSTELPCQDRAACGGRARMPLCDLLLQPRIGPHAADLDGGGPRPRMGGGWRDAALGDLIERASAGSNLPEEELTRLGGALRFLNMDELYDEEDRLENRRGNPQ